MVKKREDYRMLNSDEKHDDMCWEYGYPASDGTVTKVFLGIFTKKYIPLDRKFVSDMTLNRRVEVTLAILKGLESAFNEPMILGGVDSGDMHRALTFSAPELVNDINLYVTDKQSNRVGLTRYLSPRHYSNGSCYIGGMKLKVLGEIISSDEQYNKLQLALKFMQRIPCF